MNFRALAAALVMFSTATIAEAAPWQLERSDVVSIEAPSGQSYDIMLSWPDGEPPAEGWPILWLLDGEHNFAMAVTTTRRLANARGRSGVSEGIIVGIASGSLQRRSKDYTPDIPEYAVPVGTPGHGLPVGGADAFLDFLKNKVEPAVSNRFKIDAKRQTLAGHSFGGLLASYELLDRGHYHRYAMVSPSLWYGDGQRSAPTAATLDHKSILITEVDDNTQAWDDISAYASQIAALGGKVQTLALSGQSHGSTMPASIVQIVTLSFGAEPK